MLLAPSNARSWAPRVKRIIFDEIHSIGQAEDGVVWEQLLLLAPCQIIALSATVGNPEEFNDWLASAQKSLGMTLTMIKHDQRYSDLRKSVYTPPKQISFKGLKEVGPSTGSHGLDNTSNLKYFHPVASLVNKSRGLPDDLTLEGRDCLYLWKSMTKHQNKEFMVPKALDPEVALPPLIKKVDVFAWEAKLKEILKQWMETSNSPFDKVLDELSSNLHEPTNQEAKGLGTPSGVSSPIDGSTGSTTGSTASSLESVEIIDPQSLTATTLPLLVRLHERNALPAIFFNYDRGQCERIARSVLTRLEKAEQRHKDTSPEWKKLVQGFEEWKKVQEAKNARKGPKVPDKKKKKGNDGSDDDDGPLSKADAVKDSASEEKNFFESFDPMEPLEKFSFANKKRYEAVLLKHDLRQLERKGLPTWLGEALKRGIGIHHAGMNRKYRTM